jgi:hypothetical protein
VGSLSGAVLGVPGVEALVHPYLDLFPHEVVVVREHHNQLIASVGCLAGEADVGWLRNGFWAFPLVSPYL